jgi:hypothetical protein
MSDRHRPQNLGGHRMSQLRLLASSLAQGLHKMAFGCARWADWGLI